MNLFISFVGIVSLLIFGFFCILQASAAPSIMELDEFNKDISYYIPNKTFPHQPNYVVISETSTDSCFYEANCKYILYDITYENIDHIGYRTLYAHFYIGGDGIIYEARGWDKMGQYEYGKEYENATLDVSFIGRYNETRPSNVQIRAAQLLLEYGLFNSYISPTYELFGQWQINKKYNLVPKIDKVIRMWPHWKSTINNV